MLNILNISDKLVRNCFIDDKKPIIINVNIFDEKSLRDFQFDINKAINTSQSIIPISVDSFGGGVYSLKGMLSSIKQVQVPVMTYIEGKAMSCGALLAAFGTKGYRFASPLSTMMIHTLSSVTKGKVEDMATDVAETKRLNQELYQALALHCGKPKNYFLNIIKEKGNSDWFLTPDEMLEHDLIDKIGYPLLETTVSVRTELRF